LSPSIQNAALKACGLEGEYSLFPIHPDDRQRLKDLIARVRSSEITGLNVTIPHKQNVIPLLDELTPTAKAIGAVNVIYLREGKLIGENTDALGFLSDLNQFISNRKSQTLAPGASAGVANRKSVLVLGAGGSARSVVYALANDDWNVTIVSRRLEQAQGLISSFANYPLHITGWDFPSLQSLISNLSLIVNTTPVGMTPNIDQSPLPEITTLPRDVFIYDLVYNPRETKLVRDARAQGLPATTGLGMLIEQAALSFEIWTGQDAPRETMRASVEGSPVSNP
jgi:shikimate dehydrogenase